MFFHLTPARISAQANVIRWHSHRGRRLQTVAEHAHQVALLADYLAPEETSLEDRYLILRLALVHDAHEAETADLPAPIKAWHLKAHGLDMDLEYRRLFWEGRDPYMEVPPHVRLLVEVADALEAAIFAQAHHPEFAQDATWTAIRAASRLGGGGKTRALACLDIPRGSVLPDLGVARG